MLAAETADIHILMIRNKTDFIEDEPTVRPFINQLKELGAEVVEVSATMTQRVRLRHSNRFLEAKWRFWSGNPEWENRLFWIS